ncbi:MAG: serine/threonine protein kinase, partial [Candidatus Wallbacteria bacterium]|nr:serine/threonine protein kinase [Candidatus Wallbacteria bacterium]
MATDSRTQKLKDYLLVKRKPSEGGFADVWEAVDQPNKRLVAIKILKQKDALNASTVKRFRLEARIGQQFQHPNIAKVYEIDENQGEHFIVMEYIDGETVKQLLCQNRLSRDECLRTIRDVLGALDYVHRYRTADVESVVHRDIKSNNIMIER